MRDGYAHPYVGLAVFYDAEGNPTHGCSGTLLSPTVFLTAGHCTEGATSAQVWFEPDVTLASGYPYSGGVTGTPYTHPDFVWSLPNTSDVGVIQLDKKVRLDTYAVLADLSYLDALATERGKQETRFTVVGHGLQEVKPTLMAERTRLQATVRLVNLRSALTESIPTSSPESPPLASTKTASGPDSHTGPTSQTPRTSSTRSSSSVGPAIVLPTTRVDAFPGPSYTP